MLSHIVCVFANEKYAVSQDDPQLQQKNQRALAKESKASAEFRRRVLQKEQRRQEGARRALDDDAEEC